MGQIEKPRGAGSVSPQIRGRGTEHDQAPGHTDPKAEAANKGPDARDALAGRRRDLDENPGIGSSAGTTDSGEHPLSDTDRGPGIDRNS